MIGTQSASRNETKARWISSDKFRASLLEHITQPFTVTEDGDLLFWNAAFEELSGYSGTELRGIRLKDLLAVEHQFEAALDQTSDAASGDLRAKDRAIPVEIRRRRVDSPGGDPLLLTLLSDVSERQRLESELRQSQKMEGIGKLAGGIAHDFNNVLTTILGLTEAMIAGRTAPNSESLREIHQAATHAAELTHSLLAFSRRQILQMKNISLDAVVQKMTKMIARLIGEDIRLDISCEEQLPPVRADQSQIEQVLLNLCLNARDAMPQGGDLRIRIHTEVLTEELRQRHKEARPGRHVSLAVLDTGEGMDEETLRRVFEPFFTRKDQGKGTGLGLSMVYGIVQQHEGFIHVTSELGKGTEFTIYFPVASGAPEAIQPPEIAAPERGSATVLVVEDEKSVRKLVLEVLSKLGYRTFAAANGEEAIKVFERWADQIDLVLLDAILPKTGAKEVYDALRSRKPSVRFVFTSGYNEVFINKKFEMDPSFAFLRKPFTTSELVTMIRNALV